MTNAPLLIGLLVDGATLAVPLVVITFLLSRFTRDIVGRSLLAIILFTAAGTYFGFALLGRHLQIASEFWVQGELAQVVVFGTMALLWLNTDGYGLTTRERAVVNLVVRGFPAKQISATLYISEYTVQEHHCNVFDKV
jgi:hypothetical protein